MKIKIYRVNTALAIITMITVMVGLPSTGSASELATWRSLQAAYNEFSAAECKMQNLGNQYSEGIHRSFGVVSTAVDEHKAKGEALVSSVKTLARQQLTVAGELARALLKEGLSELEKQHTEWLGKISGLRIRIMLQNSRAVAGSINEFVEAERLRVRQLMEMLEELLVMGSQVEEWMGEEALHFIRKAPVNEIVARLMKGSHSKRLVGISTGDAFSYGLWLQGVHTRVQTGTLFSKELPDNRFSADGNALTLGWDREIPLTAGDDLVVGVAVTAGNTTAHSREIGK